MHDRVLYLSYDGMTDPLGQSQVIPYLQGLSKRGYQFTLISFEKELRYQTYGHKVGNILQESDIDWIPLKYQKHPPVLSTLFDIWLMKRNAVSLYKASPYAIVHCRSYLSALVGLRMKKKFGVKFLFDMRGFWADERVEGGIWNQRNPIFRLTYNYFKRKEKQFLEQADYTISLTHSAKKEIHHWQYLKNNPVPIKVIPCCADLQHFSRKNIDDRRLEQLRTSLGLQDNDFVLVYLGSLGTWYRLDEMLRFFKELLNQKEKAKFLIISRDVPFELSHLFNTLNIPEDRVVVASADRVEVPVYLKLSDLAIFFYQPSFSKKATSPTKQGEIMGMGIPIVCNAGVGDTAEIIQQTNSGAVVANLSEKEYRSVCRKVDSLVSLSTDEIRMSAKKYYSLEDGIEAYADVYKKLL